LHQFFSAKRGILTDVFSRFLATITPIRLVLLHPKNMVVSETSVSGVIALPIPPALTSRKATIKVANNKGNLMSKIVVI
jgi:hypothetical protein